jgi:hypothetical protein
MQFMVTSHTNVGFQCRIMAQSTIRLCLTAEAKLRFLPSSSERFYKHSGTGVGFCPSTWGHAVGVVG